MPNLREINIKKDKTYLVLSEHPNFLENARDIICNMFHIPTKLDTKTRKNSMAFEPILFHDHNGLIKFDIYTDNIVHGCHYDYVLVDRDLFVNKYVDVHSQCILSTILCVHISEDAYIDTVQINTNDNIIDRGYDIRYHYDYGKCPACGKIVYETETKCPYCNKDITWRVNKDIILDRCRIVIDAKEAGNLEIASISEDSYDPYVNITGAFDYDELSMMSEKELLNLVKLAKYITNSLYQ